MTALCLGTEGCAGWRRVVCGIPLGLIPSSHGGQLLPRCLPLGPVDGGAGAFCAAGNSRDPTLSARCVGSSSGKLWGWAFPGNLLLKFIK